METSQLTAMSSRISENEQITISRIEEVKSLQFKITDLERQHASQIESLYINIADQESKYKVKVEEINGLQ